MTNELAAARFNNFYEFGLNKERWWREAAEDGSPVDPPGRRPERSLTRPIGIGLFPILS